MEQILNLQNYQWNLGASIYLLGGLWSYVVGIFLGIKQRRTMVWPAYFAAGSWMFGYAFAHASTSPQIALFWVKYALTGVIFIAPMSYHFTVHYFEFKNQRKYVFLVYILAFLFVFLLHNTNFFIKGINERFWGYHTVAHPTGYLLHTLYFSAVYLALFVNFYRIYKKWKGTIRAVHAKGLLLAYGIAGIGAIDYIVDFGFDFYPFGHIITIVGVSVVAYTVVKYKLFEIETVIHKTTLWAATILILVVPVGGVSLVLIRLIPQNNTLMSLMLMIVCLLFFYYYYSYLRPRIDHIFRRRKYDYLQILGRISQETSGILDLEELSRKTILGIKDTVYPGNIHLFLKDEDKKRFYLTSYIEKEEYKFFNKEDSLFSIPQNTEYLQILKDTKQPLEKEMLTVDPLYKEAREEASQLFDKTESLLLFGLFMEEDLVGLLLLGKRENLQPYTRMDINALNNLAQEIGNFFYTSLHHEDIMESQRLRQEIALAQHIQENLLPQEAPEVQGIRLYGLYVPSREIGGDYYDFIQATDGGEDKGNLYITIGDVSGKGLDAGLIMAVLKTSIANLSKFYSSPSEMLGVLNSFLYSQVRQQKFVSLLLFNYSSRSPDRMTYSSAGHEHILIYRKSDGKDIEVIKSGGIILGMLEDIENMIEEHTITLNREDKILLYTDGAIEARNPQEDLFGLPNLIESFRKHAHLPVKDTIHNINQDIKEFISSRDQYDDITLVGIEKE